MSLQRLSLSTCFVSDTADFLNFSTALFHFADVQAKPQGAKEQKKGKKDREKEKGKDPLQAAISGAKETIQRALGGETGRFSVVCQESFLFNLNL